MFHCYQAVNTWMLLINWSGNEFLKYHNAAHPRNKKGTKFLREIRRLNF